MMERDHPTRTLQTQQGRIRGFIGCSSQDFDAKSQSCKDLKRKCRKGVYILLLFIRVFATLCQISPKTPSLTIIFSMHL